MSPVPWPGTITGADAAALGPSNGLHKGAADTNAAARYAGRSPFERTSADGADPYARASNSFQFHSLDTALSGR